MTPRDYDMGARASAAAETRAAIIAAAIGIYAREGFRSASMNAIARAADVSPTTVTNHFAAPEQLLEAALAELMVRIDIPEPAELSQQRRLEDRLSYLALEMSKLYDRTSDWYAIYAKDRDLPPVQAASQVFFAKYQALVSAALGPELANRRTATVVAVLLGPETNAAFRASGLSVQKAAETSKDILLAWLRRRKGT